MKDMKKKMKYGAGKRAMLRTNMMVAELKKIKSLSSKWSKLELKECMVAVR